MPRAAPGWHLPARTHKLHKRAVALVCAIVIWSFASSAMAASEPSTKLVNCDGQSCLLVSGHRDDPASIVSINGHVVPVKGKRGWRVRLPVETVREWSAPFARTIEVSFQAPEAQSARIARVALPIGLLGHLADLAPLVVSVR